MYAHSRGTSVDIKAFFVINLRKFKTKPPRLQSDAVQ
jgi:hypothetical protein